MTALAWSRCPYGQIPLAKEANFWLDTTKETYSWNQDAVEGQSEKRHEGLCIR